MSTITQAVERRQQTKPALSSLVEQMRPEISRALPKHMDADRMARLALTCLRQTPKLADCTPESFLGALLTASALGLEPGVNGEAYLVPHGRECTLILGYQGLVKLYLQHPDAQHIDAQAVYENDDFDYAYGLQPFLRHKPARGDRGEVTEYYACATLKSGSSAFVVLSPEEVKALRGGKSGGSGGIPDPMHWFERKTAIRQLIKLLPKSTALAQAVTVDERSGTQLRAERAPEQITDGALAMPALEAAEVINEETGEVTAEGAWPEVPEVAK